MLKILRRCEELGIHSLKDLIKVFLDKKRITSSTTTYHTLTALPGVGEQNPRYTRNTSWVIDDLQEFLRLQMEEASSD